LLSSLHYNLFEAQKLAIFEDPIILRQSSIAIRRQERETLDKFSDKDFFQSEFVINRGLHFTQQKLKISNEQFTAQA